MTDGRRPAIRCLHVLRTRLVDSPRTLRRHVGDTSGFVPPPPPRRLPRVSSLDKLVRRQRPSRSHRRANSRICRRREHDVHRYRARLAYGPLGQARPAVLVGDRLDRARSRWRRPRYRPASAALGSTGGRLAAPKRWTDHLVDHFVPLASSLVIQYDVRIESVSCSIRCVFPATGPPTLTTIRAREPATHARPGPDPH